MAFHKHLLCVSVILILLALPILDNVYCLDAVPASSVSGKSSAIDKSKINQGYMLFAPFSTIDNLTENGSVYLTDLFGKTLHKWQTKYQALYSILNKNGNLFVELIIPGMNSNFPAGGRTGLIQELDWDGNVLWEYKNDKLHHDFDILPNGNIVAIVWEPLTKNIASQIKGGVSGTEFNGDMWSDGIIEIDRAKNVVWSWHLGEHINQSEEVLSAYTPRAELGHSNSLRYVMKNPFDGEEAYLLSIRHLNSIFLIRKRDGDVIWRSPKDMLSFQHDATLLANGNILVFDNGLNRNPKPRPIQGSRVLEINPQTNNIIWEFNGGQNGTERARFKADIISGAQRLSNGNTLIIDGLRGHMFEVTPDKKIVWDMINPYSSITTGPWPNNSIFKARRYETNEINWPEKFIQPISTIASFCAKIRDLF